MKGFILFLVAVVLFIPAVFVCLIYVLNEYGWTRKTFKGYFGVLFREIRVFVKNLPKPTWELNRYFYGLALDINMFSNGAFKTLWNKTLIIPTGYKFGDRREPMSSALGKNFVGATYSRRGLALICTIDIIDFPLHCKRAIKDLPPIT